MKAKKIGHKRCTQAKQQAQHIAATRQLCTTAPHVRNPRTSNPMITYTCPTTQARTEQTHLHIALRRCPRQTYRPTICTWSQNWSFQALLSTAHTTFLTIRNSYAIPFRWSTCLTLHLRRFWSHSKTHAMSEHLPKLEECEAAVMNQIIGPLVRQTILSTEPCRYLCPSFNLSCELAKLGLPSTISRIICPMSLIITSCFLVPHLHSPCANSTAFVHWTEATLKDKLLFQDCTTSQEATSLVCWLLGLSPLYLWVSGVGHLDSHRSPCCHLCPIILRRPSGRDGTPCRSSTAITKLMFPSCEEEVVYVHPPSSGMYCAQAHPTRWSVLTDITIDVLQTSFFSENVERTNLTNVPS